MNGEREVWDETRTQHQFEGQHIFANLGGHPHCIFCGQWRSSDTLRRCEDLRPAVRREPKK